MKNDLLCYLLIVFEEKHWAYIMSFQVEQFEDARTDFVFF